MPTTEPTTDTTDQPTTRRRRLVIAALLLLLLFSLLAASFGSRRSTDAAPDAADNTAAGATAGDSDKEGSDEDAEEDALGAAEQPFDFDVDLVDGDADPGDPGGSDFGDDGGTVDDPCADHDPADGNLMVGPDPLTLPSGEMTGKLHVRNCGTDDVAWSAATKPSVALATAGGTLDPGEAVPIGLTIDDEQWDPGAIEFKVRVTEGAFVHNTYVDVHAFEPLVGEDVAVSDQISGGEGQGGCNHQCIYRAQLSTGYSSPDVGLDVGTTVPALVKVYLSQNPPLADLDGNPTFGTAPKATSPDGVKSWKTSLTGLAPTTKYFIIVKATDGNGHSAYRHGSFRTITPVQQDGGFAVGGDEPGCGAGCMTKATVTPGDGSDPAKVVVRTNIPATFELMLSRNKWTTKDGHPHFDKKDVWHASGLEHTKAWDSEVNGLQPSTKYYGIITATDANGKRDYATGQLMTDGVDVIITMHSVHVDGDGDTGWYSNPGELSFVWGVDDQPVGYRGERKMHAGENISFAEHERTYTVHDATGTLPTVKVNAFERDADGLAEFCSGGFGIFDEPGYNKKCDWKWNPAIGPAIQAGILAQLPDCSALGVDTDADGCLRIESEHQSDDYADIVAIVSYTYVD